MGKLILAVHKCVLLRKSTVKELINSNEMVRDEINLEGKFILIDENKFSRLRFSNINAILFNENSMHVMHTAAVMRCPIQSAYLT